MAQAMPPFEPGPSPRRVALVGNGPVAPGAAARIDAADWVVRFNRARGFGAEAGARVDDLFLVNVGGQPLEWLDDRTFTDRPVLAATRRVTLPIAAEDAESGLAALARGANLDGINFARDLSDRLAGVAQIRILPETVRRAAVAALAGPGFWPSTGALALFWYDRMAGPEMRFDLHGFGFQGAAMHDWTRERAWAETLMRRGRVRIAETA